MAVIAQDDTEFSPAQTALAADSPLHHFMHRLLADNVGAVVS